MALILPAKLRTARLVLRPWRSDDRADLREALIESVEHLRPWIPWATPAAPTDAEVGERLTRWMDDFATGRHGVYAVRDHEERLIGGAGLYDRVGPGALEIGYWVRRTRAGAGYATEAADALTTAGFSLPGVTRLTMHCAPANTASRRVPEKLGYRLIEERPIPFRDGVPQPTVIYQREAA